MIILKKNDKNRRCILTKKDISAATFPNSWLKANLQANKHKYILFPSWNISRISPEARNIFSGERNWKCSFLTLLTNRHRWKWEKEAAAHFRRAFKLPMKRLQTTKENIFKQKFLSLKQIKTNKQVARKIDRLQQFSIALSKHTFQNQFPATSSK